MTHQGDSVDDVVDALEQLAQYGIPSPNAARFLDVGSSAFLNYFEREVLSGMVDHGGSTCKIFEGPYGSGKTHLLQLLKGLGFERKMAVVWTDLSQNLGLTDWRLIVQHVLQNIEAPVGGTVYKSLPRILNALQRSERGNVSQSLLAAPHAGFAKAMMLASKGEPRHPEGRELLSRYLQGERVTVSELRRFGITGVKDPLSARNSEHVLKTVLAGVRHFGLSGTLLLFDENEKTLAFNRTNPPRRVVAGANLLRRLVDGTVGGTFSSTVAVFAVLQGFVENCALAYPALGQRLQIVRNPGAASGWRTPVLTVDSMTTTPTAEAFLEGLSLKLEGMASQCGMQNTGLRKRLSTAGSKVLSVNAGMGYKRDLVRELATITVSELDAMRSR